MDEDREHPIYGDVAISITKMQDVDVHIILVRFSGAGEKGALMGPH